MLIKHLEYVPQQLIARRKANGWTQKHLAEKLGMKEQQIQRYEAQKYQCVSLRRLTQIAEVLFESNS